MKRYFILAATIVTVIILAGALYFFIGRQFLQKQANKISSATQSQKLQPINVTSWKTYSNQDFSFQYPSDWQIATQDGKIPGGTQKSETISDVSFPAISSTGSGSTDPMKPPEGGTITVNKTTNSTDLTEQLFPSTVFDRPTTIKLGNKNVSAYTQKYHGPEINYMTISYNGSSGDYYAISFGYYNYRHPDWDYPALFDQIINSFKFNNEK